MGHVFEWIQHGHASIHGRKQIRSNQQKPLKNVGIHQVSIGMKVLIVDSWVGEKDPIVSNQHPNDCADDAKDLEQRARLPNVVAYFVLKSRLDDYHKYENTNHQAQKAQGP